MQVVQLSNRRSNVSAVRYLAQMLLTLLALASCKLAAAEPAITGARANALFVKVETALKAGQTQVLTKHEAELAGYPLLPYLQAQFLEANLAKVNEPLLLKFLQRHPQTPFGRDLRERWLYRLAKNSDHQRFLRDYQASKDLQLQCRYLQFQLQQTKAAESRTVFYQAFTALWLRGSALPAACAEVEALWTSASQRTPELLWQRLELALDDGDAALQKTLTALLPLTEQSLIKNWQSLHNRPEQLLQPLAVSASPVALSAILADTLERLVWRDRDAALSAWNIQEAEQRLPPALRDRVATTFALALATDAHPAADLWLANLSGARLDERMAGWRVTTAMRQQHWPHVQTILAALPAELRERPRFRYFAARTQAELNGAAAAAPLFSPLSERQDYYGLLARAQLPNMSKLSAPALLVDAEQLSALRRLPAMRRVQALLDLRRSSAARREWQFAVADFTEAQLRAAAVIADEWGWTDRAITSLRQGNSQGDWDILFPLPHKTQMQTESERRQIDLNWAYAISRQESLFVADIRSSAGALGLMQLMPTTAKATAKRFKIGYRGQQELLAPATNIRLGVAYLSELLARNDGNLVYATAAYNAGQSRVNRWVARDGHLPLDIWIEAIPFKETQGYVKNVTAFSLIYAQRLDEVPTAFNQLLASLGTAKADKVDTPLTLPTPAKATDQKSGQIALPAKPIAVVDQDE